MVRWWEVRRGREASEYDGERRGANRHHQCLCRRTATGGCRVLGSSVGGVVVRFAFVPASSTTVSVLARSYRASSSSSLSLGRALATRKNVAPSQRKSVGRSLRGARGGNGAWKRGRGRRGRRWRRRLSPVGRKSGRANGRSRAEAAAAAEGKERRTTRRRRTSNEDEDEEKGTRRGPAQAGGSRVSPSLERLTHLAKSPSRTHLPKTARPSSHACPVHGTGPCNDNGPWFLPSFCLFLLHDDNADSSPRAS
jgi:hypothetical protein